MLTGSRSAATPASVPAPRVLQVVLNLKPGGTERLVVEIVKRLSPAVASAVCCLDEAGAWATEVTERGVPVWPLWRAPGFRPALGLRIARLAEDWGATVLHCHHYSSLVYGRIAALWNPRLRIVFTEHGRLSDAPPSRKRRLVNPVLTRFPGQLYAVSADLRAHLLAEGFPHRTGVIYNGVDTGAVTTVADRVRAREVLGIADDAFVLGTVGRLDPVKDLATLLRACARAQSRAPKLTVVVIGDGETRAALEQQAGRLGLAGCVRFSGHREDVRALMPAFDAYVNSSIYEGVSLTILEAMSASLPVVATRVGGTPEVVADGTTGLLVPSRDPDALGNAIARLAAAPEERRQMGRAGRERVERLFTLDRMVRDYLNAYMGAMTPQQVADREAA